MTSVASEVSALLNAPSSSRRTSSSKTDRTDGGFAALMERQVERRDDPKPARRERAQSPRIERNDPADRSTPSDSAARSDAPAQSKETKVADRPTEKPAAKAKDGAQPAEGVTGSVSEEKPGNGDALVAATVVPPVPVSQPVEAPALPVAPVAADPAVTAPVEAPVAPVEAPLVQAATTPTITAPALATPETDIPQQGQPAETAGQIAVPVPTAQVPDTPATISAPESASVLPAKPQMALKTEQPLADDEATNAESSIETPQAELPEKLLKQTKQPAAQAQTNGSNKPELTTDPAFKPDDFLSTPKLTTEHTPQLMPHMPMHVTAATTAAPQANPVSTAQAVPVNAIAVEIAGQAKAGNTRFEIRLDPPELGRIDVRLDVDKDGNVTSRLVIERADTYDLLRRDQSTLERALQQAGLKTSENALEFSLRDQGFAQQQQKDDNPQGIHAIVAETDVIPSEAANGYARLLGGRSGVDIRV